MRKRITFCGACLAGIASIAAGDTAVRAPQTALEHEVIANERAIAKAVAAGDERAFARLVANDAITVGPRGVTTAAEEEKRMPAAASWRISDAHVKPIDDRVAIVYYRGTEDAPSGAAGETAWHSTLWVRQHGAWVAEFHQQTPMTPDTTPVSASVSSAAARAHTISATELRDRIQLAKDLASELINASRPLPDTAASPASTLITVDRWPLEQLRTTIRDLASVAPGTAAPRPGSLRAHMDRANAIAGALAPERGAGDTVIVDRTAIERLSVELDALSNLTPLT